jgi:hypothetical protein
MSIIKFKIFKESLNDRPELHYFAFDWDDNILHMSTTILMDKKEGEKWLPVEVSTSEYAKVRTDAENYRLRNNDPVISFSGFRDNGPRGSNSFIEDVKIAIDKKDFGPSWEKFLNCLKDGSIFSIITARGHEPETIKKAVEYIIDTILSDDDQHLLYNNCLKHAYIFGHNTNFDRIPKGDISKTKLIQTYLEHCDFYGVSSQSFASQFGEASASNPEKAKEMALEQFIEKCNDFGKKVGAKSVSIGFSDDDPKNVDHVRKYFKEKSSLSDNLSHELKLSLHKTTDRNIKGGEITKFRKGEEKSNELTVSTQAPGMASSIMSFSSFNNQGSRLFPSNIGDNDPVAHTHRMATDYISKKSKEWTEDFKKNLKGKKKIKKSKLLKENTNYMFFNNLETMKKMIDELVQMDSSNIDEILNEHDWASDHISVANENIEHVYNFLKNQ